MPDTRHGSDAHRHFDAVIDTINCGLVGRDAKGVVTFVNDRLLAWLGYEREEIVGDPTTKMIPEDLHAVVLEEMEAIDAGDLRARLATLRRKDSTTFPVLVIPQRIIGDDGEVVGAFSVIVDLGMVQTAKRTGLAGADDFRATLERIAMELHSISLFVDVPGGTPLSLDHRELAELTPREREVLVRLTAGDRVPTIARQAHVSAHTVRSHLKSIFRKLGVSSQAELLERVRKIQARPPRVTDH